MAYGKRNNATVTADDRARALAPIIEVIKSASHNSPQAIAKELNRAGVRTPNRARWHASTVKQLIAPQRSLHNSGDCTIAVDGVGRLLDALEADVHRRHAYAGRPKLRFASQFAAVAIGDRQHVGHARIDHVVANHTAFIVEGG